MRKQLTILGATTAACVFAGAALAQDADRSDADGWYLAGAGTVSLLDDAPTLVTGTPNPGGVVQTVQATNTGYGVQAALGRKFGGFRLEAEAGYSTNHSDHYTAIIPATGRIPSDGDLSALRLMANGYVDLGSGPVQPYLGGGIGWTRVHVRVTAPRAPFPTEAPMRLIDHRINALAYQLAAGAAVRLSPKLSLTAQYRWHGSGDIDGADLGGRPFTRHHAGHNIDVGIRVRL